MKEQKKDDVVQYELCNDNFITNDLMADGQPLTFCDVIRTLSKFFIQSSNINVLFKIVQLYNESILNFLNLLRKHIVSYKPHRFELMLRNRPFCCGVSEIGLLHSNN